MEDEQLTIDCSTLRTKKQTRSRVETRTTPLKPSRLPKPTYRPGVSPRIKPVVKPKPQTQAVVSPYNYQKPQVQLVWMECTVVSLLGEPLGAEVLPRGEVSPPLGDEHPAHHHRLVLPLFTFPVLPCLPYESVLYYLFVLLNREIYSNKKKEVTTCND